MRILAGKYKGRKIISPSNKLIRPTSEKVRGVIFNMINSYFIKNNIDFKNMVILDCFSGTGSFGIEAYSRGAKKVIFSDLSKDSLNLTRKNLKIFDLKNSFEILKIDYTKKFLSISEIDLFFMDPPYKEGILEISLKNLISSNWLRKKSFGIIETDSRDFCFLDFKIHLIKKKKIGKSYIYFVDL